MATALLKGVRRGPKGLGGGPNDGFTTGADKVSLNTCKVTASSETSKCPEVRQALLLRAAHP